MATPLKSKKERQGQGISPKPHHHLMPINHSPVPDFRKRNKILFHTRYPKRETTITTPETSAFWLNHQFYKSGHQVSRDHQEPSNMTQRGTTASTGILDSTRRKDTVLGAHPAFFSIVGKAWWVNMAVFRSQQQQPIVNVLFTARYGQRKIDLLKMCWLYSTNYYDLLNLNSGEQVLMVCVWHRGNTMGHVWITMVVPQKAPAQWLELHAELELFFMGHHLYLGGRQTIKATKNWVFVIQKEAITSNVQLRLFIV